MNNPGMGLIRITKIPDSEAPEDIRKAWIGLVLPCAKTTGFWGIREFEVLTDNACQSRRGFYVPQNLAIKILEQTAPKAASWWRAHGFPKPCEGFTFGEDEAEVVSQVIVITPSLN